jgi:hypothetical protein
LWRYRDITPKQPHSARSATPSPFKQFGLQLRFAQAVEIALHDRDMVLDASVRDGQLAPANKPDTPININLFSNGAIADLLGNIVLEQPRRYRRDRRNR